MFGDLPRYKIASVILRVTGKSDFPKLTICSEFKRNQAWGLINL